MNSTSNNQSWTQHNFSNLPLQHSNSNLNNNRYLMPSTSVISQVNSSFYNKNYSTHRNINDNSYYPMMNSNFTQTNNFINNAPTYNNSSTSAYHLHMLLPSSSDLISNTMRNNLNSVNNFNFNESQLNNNFAHKNFPINNTNIDI